MNLALLSTILDTLLKPFIVDEALSSPPWIATMQVERDSMERNGTWSLVSCPFKCKVIGVCWVYKTRAELRSSQVYWDIL